jgi:hypothetical protein
MMSAIVSASARTFAGARARPRAPDAAAARRPDRRGRCGCRCVGRRRRQADHRRSRRLPEGSTTPGKRAASASVTWRAARHACSGATLTAMMCESGTRGCSASSTTKRRYQSRVHSPDYVPRKAIIRRTASAKNGRFGQAG